MTQVTFTHGPLGNEIAIVPLWDREDRCVGYARLDRADFDALMADGWSDRWYLNKAGLYAYPSVPDTAHRGANVTVARLIVGRPAGRIVRYRDGDRRNLCRANLEVTQGHARGKTPVERKPGGNSAQNSEGAYDE